MKRAAVPGKKNSSRAAPGAYFWGMPRLRFLRAVSLTEGLSFLLLEIKLPYGKTRVMFRILMALVLSLAA